MTAVAPASVPASIDPGLLHPTRADEAELAALLRRLTGITLSDGKGGFLAARLARRLSETGCVDFAAYRHRLSVDPNERTRFAEAMVTHTTSFFREAPQFDWLIAEELPRLARERPGRRVAIWSAACSTGQEGYTALIAARMAEISHGVSLDASVIGTDLSREALRQAARAVYTASQTENIPSTIRSEVLLSSREGPDRIRIAPELRRRATWRRANLSTAEGLDGIRADVAFLRNVLIYFDAEIRIRVLDTVCRHLQPGAVLFVGHTEAGQVRHPGLTAIRPSILRWTP